MATAVKVAADGQLPAAVRKVVPTGSRQVLVKGEALGRGGGGLMWGGGGEEGGATMKFRV